MAEGATESARVGHGKALRGGPCTSAKSILGGAGGGGKGGNTVYVTQNSSTTTKCLLVTLHIGQHVYAYIPYTYSL